MTTYISFSAEINPKTTENLIKLFTQYANQNVDHIYLILSTPGGSVMHGIALYNIMRAMPFKLTTHNVGNIDSIGNVVFLAGEERYACPNSTFMFHGVGFDIAQTRLEQKNLEEFLNTILRDQARMASILTSRSKLSINDTKKLFKKMEIKDAKFACEKGIIQKILDIKIPANTPIFSFLS